MKKNKEAEHFLDKNTLLACLLVLAGWFAWDSYMRKKYPSIPSTEDPSIEKSQESKQSSLTASVGFETVSSERRLEKTLDYSDSDLFFTLSSQGMGFKEFKLNRILNREEKAVWVFHAADKHTHSLRAFETRIFSDKPLNFTIRRAGDYVFEGIAKTKGIWVKKTLTIEPQELLIHTKVEFGGNLDRISEVYTLLIPNTLVASQKKGFLSFFSQPDFLSFFVFSSTAGAKTTIFYSDNPDWDKYTAKPSISSLQIASVGTKYFGQAWVDESDVEADFRFIRHHQNLIGELKHSVLNKNDFSLAYRVFMGPKSLKLLSQQHPKLVQWVDFGWFGSLARAILQVLTFFYSLVHNWGLSIILLTLLVRFLLLPLVLSSHRSMEVMKAIQPEIKKIRERFKKDPQRMNQEVMALMKTHRANPLGGCLPMLLQIPVFWALWKALGSSYSLYRSPFVLWIQDLSWKDPYYVLPILIGGLMFVQQKIIPVSLSPEMAKAMQFLPIVIAVFMINLPSGLTLYVFVSSLFGLLQQIYLNKDNVLIKKGV